MKILLATKLTAKFLLPIFASAILILTQAGKGIFNLTDSSTPELHPESQSSTSTFDTLRPATQAVQPNQAEVVTDTISYQVDSPVLPSYSFANPAGCSATQPDLNPAQMLANVQNAIGNEYNLAERRQLYVWNGEQGSMLNVTNDPFIYEFTFNEFQHPLTYRGDKVATIFMTQGFVVWFREYSDSFRLTAIPMTDGVMQSAWAPYVA